MGHDGLLNSLRDNRVGGCWFHQPVTRQSRRRLRARSCLWAGGLVRRDRARTTDQRVGSRGPRTITGASRRVPYAIIKNARTVVFQNLSEPLDGPAPRTTAPAMLGDEPRPFAGQCLCGLLAPLVSRNRRLKFNVAQLIGESSCPSPCISPLDVDQHQCSRAAIIATSIMADLIIF